MEFTSLLLNIENSVATLTINRPDKLNALNSVIFSELDSAFKFFKNSDEVKVIIITGAGEKAFVAGADIKELNTLNAVQAKTLSENGQRVFDLIEGSEKPVIAAVNGFALGGGCELALACHIRYCSSNAKFGQPEINLGLIPGYGGTQRLPRLINTGRALEFILSGDIFDANEAFRLGVVSRVFEPSELMTKTKEFALKLASKPLHALRFNVKTANSINNLHLAQGLQYEAVTFGMCFETEDFKEGTTAFLEKRKPVFTDK